jgi:pyrroloquinoline quinone biosynthesis protein B
MRIKILGSAAGGGFPQWNCGCSNCSRMRRGEIRGSARTQSQVAISADGQRWCLLNASPDLLRQIEATPELQCRQGPRRTPVAAVLLTNADLDHVLGLLSLRESQPLRIYSTPSVRRVLEEGNSFFAAMNEARWQAIMPGKTFDPQDADGKPLGLRCRAVALSGECGGYPRYVPQDAAAKLPADEAVIGLVIENISGESTGGENDGARLAYLPGLPTVSGELLEVLESCDLIMVDGTFWSEDELIRAQGFGNSARQMGHLPLSGEDGTLRRLAGLRRPRKVLIHINNTNPILDEDSAEHKEAQAAGWEVAEDQWELQLSNSLATTRR